MNLLKDVADTVAGMFAGDARLAAALLLVVAGAAALTRVGGFDPLFGGVALLLGSALALIASVLRSARTPG